MSTHKRLDHVGRSALRGMIAPGHGEARGIDDVPNPPLHKMGGRS